jgi:hypothetical protein
MKNAVFCNVTPRRLGRFTSFRKNKLSPSSGYKKFYRENGVSGMLRKVDKFVPDCTASHPQNSYLYNALDSAVGNSFLLVQKEMRILDFFSLIHNKKK